MPEPWNKGFNKNNNPSVRKISDTFKKKGIDNFAAWRSKHKIEYKDFVKNGDLAELIGVTLGDGHIHKYVRTEELSIISNSNNEGFALRCGWLMQTVFDKNPSYYWHIGQNSIKIRIYQRHISKRLGIPTGNRAKNVYTVPKWILTERQYIVRYLRGLYEAEGSFCVHKPTYTYKLLFANKNESLLNIVLTLMRELGFTPHKSKYQIQISKKAEAYKAIELLEFRKYK